MPAQATALEQVASLLRQTYRARKVLLTDSGTTALALALRLAMARRPDAPRIALPGWSCYDLATAADTAGAGVVLYDLDPTTLSPDRDSLDAALSQGVAAVVVVHAYGIPVNLSEVLPRAELAGALVIEDAAQAVGASLQGLPAGATAPLGVLSFGRGKGWTGGGGGALLLNPSAPPDLHLADPAGLEAPAAQLKIAAKLSVQWMLARPGLYAIPSALPFLRLGQTIYRAPEPMARMSNGEAGTLLETARLQTEEADRRRSTAVRLAAAVQRSGAGTVPVVSNQGTGGWLRFPLLPSDRLLARARTPEARRLGIMPGYPIPLGRLSGFAARALGGEVVLPGAEQLAARLITLPCHGQLSSGDIGSLEDWLSPD